MLANSALDKPAEFQARAAISSSSCAPLPRRGSATAGATVQETQPLGEKQASKTGAKKAQAERRKRYAERKARRQAEKAKRQQSEPSDYQEAPVMAFGGDDRPDFGYFGD